MNAETEIDPSAIHSDEIKSVQISKIPIIQTASDQNTSSSVGKDHANKPKKPIVVGKILTTHGVQGQLKVQSMMQNPSDLEKITPFWINDKIFSQWSLFKSTGNSDIFLARLPDILTMNQAADLRHAQIKIDRSQLPTLVDEVYYSDLIDKEVVDSQGVSMGCISHVHDFGAGPVLELNPSGKMVSFYALKHCDSDILHLKISAAMVP